MVAVDVEKVDAHPMVSHGCAEVATIQHDPGETALHEGRLFGDFVALLNADCWFPEIDARDRTL
jgi:hypothetical protein